MKSFHKEKKLAAMFLNKWAALVWLKVLRVWPERLKDISEADAKAEGYPGITEFIEAYRKINPKADSNPWNWVYEFELIERPK